MNHSEQLYDNYYFDRTSPTGLRYLNDSDNNKKKSGDVAGLFRKQKGSEIIAGFLTFFERVDGVRKTYTWSLPRIIYEHYYEYELKPYETIYFKDGNSTNLNPDNLQISRRTVRRSNITVKETSKSFRVKKTTTVVFETKEKAEEFSIAYNEFLKKFLVEDGGQND